LALPGSTPSPLTDFLVEADDDGNIFYDCDSDVVPPVSTSSPTVEAPLSPKDQSLEFSAPQEMLPKEVTH
jgi:hypothetical protein